MKIEKLKVILRDANLSISEKEEIVLFLNKEYGKKVVERNDSLSVGSERCPTCGKLK